MQVSKSANAGELRTPVYFKEAVRRTDVDGFVSESEVNVFGQDSAGNDIPAMTKWVNVHGTESFVAMQLMLRDPATITMRYSPLINEKLTVYNGTDTKPFEVISIDDVENRHVWLEIKVQRRVSAK